MQRDIEPGGRLAAGAPVHVQPIDQRQCLGGGLQGIGTDSRPVAPHDSEGREQAVAHELQHFAAVVDDRLHHAAEIVIEQGDEIAAGHGVGQRSEALQVGEEQHGFHALDFAAQHRAGIDATRRIVAEIGRQKAMTDRARRHGLDGDREDLDHLSQQRDVLDAIAARLAGRRRDHQPAPFGMLDLGGAADPRCELAQRQDPTHPFDRTGRLQLLENRQGRYIGAGVEAIAPLGDAIAQHGIKRTLPYLCRIDLGVDEFELLGDALPVVPDEAARPHHGVQGVHADEQPFDGHPCAVEPTAEAVDQILERHVAQARLGQPFDQGG